MNLRTFLSYEHLKWKQVGKLKFCIEAAPDRDEPYDILINEDKDYFAQLFGLVQPTLFILTFNITTA